MITSVVLDTNVLVAAGFNPGSHAARIVAAVRQGQLRLAWNAATRAESAAVLPRIPRRAWDEVADLFRPADRYDGPTDLPRFAAVPDAADRVFAALAAAVDATLISNDQHLLLYAPPLGVAVHTPRGFWQDWAASLQSGSAPSADSQ